jgi:UDP-N-acetyl-2-amino-2-deoxyglucuronate dehydrogenase
MTIIRFAIIGCGRIAQRHAEQINKQGRLEAVCDVISAKADELAVQYNARSYYNIDDLFLNEKNLDVIVVCTPNGLHAQHSIQSLQAGFHVLCEKPMALNVKDATEMVETANKSNRKLFVVKQNRFNPPVAAVKKALDEKRLGKIFSLQLNCFWNRAPTYYENSWKGTLQFDGGTLYTQFSHFIDLLYWLIGDVKQVNAFMSNYAHKDIIEFEDTGVVLLEFTNGAIGTLNYTVNSYGLNMEGSLTLFGEKGTVKIGGQYLNELEYQNIRDYRIDNLPPGNIANNYGTYTGSMSNHDKVYDNVIDVLQNDAQVSATAEEGLKTVEIIQKIYKAAIRL